MKIVKISKDKIKLLKPFAIALGFFDGIHLGHKKIINKTIKYAKNNSLKSAVFTFTHSPKDTIAENKKSSTITGISDNILTLKEMKIDYLIVLDADKKNLTSITAEDFVKNYLQKMGAKHAVCGKDYRFGQDKLGQPTDISKYSNNTISVDVEEFVTMNGVKISSRLIKQFLRENNIIKTAKFLGREFSIVGKVTHGKKIGRKIGFKTANITIIDEFSIELCGVFAVEIDYLESVFQGVANVGFAPTREDKIVRKSVEVYLFDFDEIIYNKTIRIKFKKFIREEMKFESFDFLTKRIMQDIKEAKKFFNKRDK